MGPDGELGELRITVLSGREALKEWGEVQSSWSE
jgi:hypothetical protein